MTAKEANKIYQSRKKFGILIDAIEKEARKGNVELEVQSIDSRYREEPYCLSDEEKIWLDDNGYFVYTIYSEVDFVADKEIVNWAK